MERSWQDMTRVEKKEIKMKNLLLSIVLVLLLVSIAAAQTPGYYLMYGNRDGSPIEVYIDSDIEIKVWAATPAIGSGYDDLDGDGVVDSINFMHTPLASNNIFIVSRNGGEVLNTTLNQWDGISFQAPDLNSPEPGFTSQSIVGFANYFDPINPLFNTNGDTVLIATFFMHTTSDSNYFFQQVNVFTEGSNPANGGLEWKMQDGVTSIEPLQTFSPLIFISYQAGDANGDCVTNGLDVIYLVNYLKGIGNAPFWGDCY